LGSLGDRGMQRVSRYMMGEKHALLNERTSEQQIT